MGVVFDRSKEEILDPLNVEMWEMLNKQMDKNVRIYREVFGCVPDNTVSDFKGIKELEEKADLKKYAKLRRGIRGYAVHYPKGFLKNEELRKMLYFNWSQLVVPN